jgi:hypothetical protein
MIEQLVANRFGLGSQGQRLADSETRVTVMITVIASAAAVRSTTPIADARDTTVSTFLAR